MKKIISILCFALLFITTKAQITISPSSIDTAYCYNQFSEKITASGGVAPYQYVVSSGTLPSGLTLNKKNGTVSGIAQTVVSSSSTYTVRVTDAAGTTATRSYTQQVTNKQPTYAENVSAFGNMPNTYPTYADAYNAYRLSVNNVLYSNRNSSIFVPYSDTMQTPNANAFIVWGTSTNSKIEIKSYKNSGNISSVAVDSTKTAIIGQDSIKLTGRTIINFSSLPTDSTGLTKGTLYRSVNTIKVKM